MLRLSALSVEYVPVEVTPTGTNEEDPSTAPVFMAVVPEGTAPLPGDWTAASWDAARWPPVAKVLVGPTGDIPLTAGNYEVWVKFGVGLESPVMPAGSLEVY